jgi:hypothetical protein
MLLEINMILIKLGKTFINGHQKHQMVLKEMFWEQKHHYGVKQIIKIRISKKCF